MDLGKESNPYYRLRNEDPIEWHLWKKSTLELARRQNKDLRVVIGSYYSQDAHFLESSIYREEKAAQALNEIFVNVIVDKDEIPAFEHFHRSILIWLLTPFQADDLFFEHSNLPLVVVLDGKTLFPKGLRNELLMLDFELHFEDESEFKLIVEEPNVGVEQDKIIQFPQQIKPDFQTTFNDYIDNVFEHNPVLSLDTYEIFWDQLMSIQSESHPTGSDLLPNIIKHGNVAAFFMQEGRSLDTDEEDSSIDLAASMLTRLARSYCFDHLTGGFFQSRVANGVLIPASEKRLSVSAYLLEVYCKAITFMDDALFVKVAKLTANFLRDQITSVDTFPTTICDLSQLDASHYTWNKRTLKKLLTEDEFLLMETLYGLDRRPTYQRSYFLECHDSWLSVVDRLFLDTKTAWELHESARRKMLEARKDSELVADDRFNPLTCAAVSKALVIAATTLGEKSYFEVAKRVMSSLIEKIRFGPTGRESERSGLDKVLLQSVDAVFVVDALLVMIEYEWDARLYTTAVDLWDSLVGLAVEDLTQVYCKPQFVGYDKPDDFAPVPDFFPFFDYQSDRQAETTVFIEIARKMACLNQIGYFLDICFNQHGAIERSIAPYEIDHVEYVRTIQSSVSFHGSIVLRGPVDKCEFWKRSLRIPSFAECPVYVIPYDMDEELAYLPEYLPSNPSKQKRNRVTAFFVGIDERLYTFTSLAKLNDHLRIDDIDEEI